MRHVGPVLAPRRLVQLLDAGPGGGVLDDDDVPALPVAAARCEAGVVEDAVQHLVGHGLVGERPRGGGGAHDLGELHRLIVSRRSSLGALALSGSAGDDDVEWRDATLGAVIPSVIPGVIPAWSRRGPVQTSRRVGSGPGVSGGTSAWVATSWSGVTTQRCTPENEVRSRQPGSGGSSISVPVAAMATTTPVTNRSASATLSAVTGRTSTPAASSAPRARAVASSAVVTARLTALAATSCQMGSMGTPLRIAPTCTLAPSRRNASTNTGRNVSGGRWSWRTGSDRISRAASVGAPSVEQRAGGEAAEEHRAGHGVGAGGHGGREHRFVDVAAVADDPSAGGECSIERSRDARGRR